MSGPDSHEKAWLISLPEIFDGLASPILQALATTSVTRLGQEYYLIKTTNPAAIHNSEVAKFLRWNLPIHHTWPCRPQRMGGFVEKAAQTLVRKFGHHTQQGIFMGPLHPGSPDKYYKSLASNLRGRTLQLFPSLSANSIEEQAPDMTSLFCLVGKEGLFCGMQSPRSSNGLYPGGSKFIDKTAPDTISRAGAKIAEALHYLLMYRPPLAPGSHWIELGACPGGMTSELLARGQRVTAIDRAPLDARLNNSEGLTFVLKDVGDFNPPPATAYDAMLSDLNGPPEESMAHIARLLPYLRESGLVVFTLKVPKMASVEEPCALFREIACQADGYGLRLFAQTHLTHNRHEFTLFFEKLKNS